MALITSRLMEWVLRSPTTAEAQARLGITGGGGGNVPVGGTANQVLAKIDATNFNTQWVSSSCPVGGALNQVLTKSSGADYDYAWAAGGAGPPGPAGPDVRSIALCSAFTPLATGADAGEVTVPYDADGTTAVTFNVKRLTLRVATAGGAPEIVVEKSTVAGAFAAATVGTVTLGAGAFEGSVTAALGTVASGNKLRFKVNTLGTALNWTVLVELSTV